MPNQSRQASASAPDNVEVAHQKFKVVVAEWSAAKVAGPTDIVKGLIKRILAEVLEWRPAELTDCKTPSAPYECIRLTIEGASRAAVIIQKTPLGLKDRNTDRPYRLDGPVLTASESAEGIKQACMVCGIKNTELAALTNGEEWIVFRGSRIGDGKDTMEGQAFLFPTLQAIQDTFKLFYDLLSRNPIVELRYRAHFQEAEGQPIRARAFSRPLRETNQLRPFEPTPLAADLDRVMESFFQRIAGDKDPEMLLQCFIVTKESKIAENQIARISEDLVGRIRSLDTASAEDLSEIIHKVQVTQRREFVLLIGTKGAGKTTFIERFFKHVLPPEIRAECIDITVDMVNCPGSESQVVEWLDDTLLKATEEALFKDKAPTYEEIQGMFFDEYRRWCTGAFRHLYETDKTAFKTEFGRHIEKRREDRPHEYICRLMRNIVASRRKAPCIVFDNADHFSIAIQEKVFQYARSIYESEVCIVIMPITDKTSWQLSRQGALQSFETISLFLPTPSPKTVLERRIKYLEEKVSPENEEKGRGYFLSWGIRLDLEHLKAFAHCLQHVFLETGRASDWVGNLSNLDIRLSLQLTREIMSSPYLRVDELLKAYIAKSTTAIPIYDIQRAIIRRNYNFYPVGNHTYVQNIFCLRTEIGTSPLLGLRILTALRDALHKETEGQEAFVEVSQIYDYFQSMMVERRVVSLWLDAMLRTGLCLSYDPTQTTTEGVQKVELSPSGRQHLIWGCTDESYISSMMEVTPIQHQPTYEKLREVPWDNKNLERLEKTDIFIQYIIEEDSDYARIPTHEAFNGQRRLVKNLIRIGHRVHEDFLYEKERRSGYDNNGPRRRQRFVREVPQPYGTAGAPLAEKTENHREEGSLLTGKETNGMEG